MMLINSNATKSRGRAHVSVQQKRHVDPTKVLNRDVGGCLAWLSFMPLNTMQTKDILVHSRSAKAVSDMHDTWSALSTQRLVMIMQKVFL